MDKKNGTCDSATGEDAWTGRLKVLSADRARQLLSVVKVEPLIRDPAQFVIELDGVANRVLTMTKLAQTKEEREQESRVRAQVRDKLLGPVADALQGWRTLDPAARQHLEIHPETRDFGWEMHRGQDLRDTLGIRGRPFWIEGLLMEIEDRLTRAAEALQKAIDEPRHAFTDCTAEVWKQHTGTEPGLTTPTDRYGERIGKTGGRFFAILSQAMELAGIGQASVSIAEKVLKTRKRRPSPPPWLCEPVSIELPGPDR